MPERRANAGVGPTDNKKEAAAKKPAIRERISLTFPVVSKVVTWRPQNQLAVTNGVIFGKLNRASDSVAVYARREDF